MSFGMKSSSSQTQDSGRTSNMVMCKLWSDIFGVEDAQEKINHACESQGMKEFFGAESSQQRHMLCKSEE
jgi:hypothetical protein